MIERTGAILLLAALVVLPELAQAQELQPPKVGSTMTWKCTGPYTRHYELKVMHIKNDIVRYDGKVDSGAYFAEKHAGLTGTSLWYRLIGKRRQWFDLEDFEDYRKMIPGSRFKGAVPALQDKDKWVWRYEISIGQPRDVDHPVLGKVQLIPISEKRSVFHGTYSSKTTTYLLPEKGLSVKWTYEDTKGEEICDLAKFSE